MMKALATYLGLLFLCTVTFAQSNFIDAIVVSKNGDSLRGKIDYRNWKNNPGTISFRTSGETENRYDASLIRDFVIPSTGERYVGYSIAMDKRPGTANAALKFTARDTVRELRSVFLLELISHPVASLYQHVGPDRENFFFRNADGKLIELVNYFLHDEDAGQVKHYEPFKTQLSELFSSCTGKYLGTNNISYSRNDLQKSFTDFILCREPGAGISVKQSEPLSVKFGVVAGAAFTTFTIGGYNELVSDDGYSSHLSPVFGGSLDIGLARNLNKWHIINELVYKSYKTGTSFTRPYNATYTVDRTIDFSFSYIQLNSLLRYVFGSGASVKPFINAGISNAVMIAEHKNNSHNVYSFGNEENVMAIDNPRKYELAIQAGAGVQVKNFSAEFRFSRNSKGFSSQHSLNTYPTSFMGLLAWHF